MEFSADLVIFRSFIIKLFKIDDDISSYVTSVKDDKLDIL